MTPTFSIFMITTAAYNMDDNGNFRNLIEVDFHFSVLHIWLDYLKIHMKKVIKSKIISDNSLLHLFKILF